MSEKLFQQVNLYQPIFRRQRHIFSAATIAQSIAILVVALTTIYVYGLWQVHALEHQLAELTRRENASANQLARLDPSDSDRRRREVEAAIAELGATLLAQRDLISVIEERPLGNVHGFSRQLAALGRRHSPGLWLTELRINGGTNSIQLIGRTTDPGMVPAYLLRLGQEEALSGQRFDRFELERVEDEDEVIFRVTSEAVAP